MTMAMIHSVDVISVAVQRQFMEQHKTDKVEFIPAIDPLGYIRAAFVTDPPSFPNILAGIQGYLEFPYAQTDENDPYSFQTEFLNRVGILIATISFFYQTELAHFLSGELRFVVEKMRLKEINVNSLSAEV